MSLSCYKCHGPGHFATSCPYNIPAADEAEHLARVALFVDWWVEGRFTRQEKRLAISAENLMFYGPDVRKALVL
jgi:hypothetical protein